MPCSLIFHCTQFAVQFNTTYFYIGSYFLTDGGLCFKWSIVALTAFISMVGSRFEALVTNVCYYISSAALLPIFSYNFLYFKLWYF